LSQHTYWNLNGFWNNTETILDHVLFIDADQYTPVDKQLIPTGSIDPVTSAPWFDFTKPKAVGRDIAKPGGYDNNWVLNKHSLNDHVLLASSSLTGISLQIYTTQPGLQFYSGNNLDGTVPRKKSQIFPAGNGHESYEHYSCLVFETQHFPDSVHQPGWPSTILKKGQIYDHKSVFKLSIGR